MGGGTKSLIFTKGEVGMEGDEEVSVGARGTWMAGDKSGEGTEPNRTGAGGDRFLK